MEPYPFDLAVISSGPAGQKGAILAAKLGKRVTRLMLALPISPALQ